MGAIHSPSPNKPAVAVEKGSLPELLGRLPLGSTLMPAMISARGDEDARRCWEVKHEKLNFWIIRDTPEEAIRAFIHAVDKRGLRPSLEGTVTPPAPPSTPVSYREQNSVPKPALV